MVRTSGGYEARLLLLRLRLSMGTIRDKGHTLGSEGIALYGYCHVTAPYDKVSRPFYTLSEAGCAAQS